jgi:hypothetical protein
MLNEDMPDWHDGLQGGQLTGYETAGGLTTLRLRVMTQREISVELIFHDVFGFVDHNMGTIASVSCGKAVDHFLCESMFHQLDMGMRPRFSSCLYTFSGVEGKPLMQIIALRCTAGPLREDSGHE